VFVKIFSSLHFTYLRLDRWFIIKSFFLKILRHPSSSILIFIVFLLLLFWLSLFRGLFFLRRFIFLIRLIVLILIILIITLVVRLLLVVWYLIRSTYTSPFLPLLIIVIVVIRLVSTLMMRSRFPRVGLTSKGLNFLVKILLQKEIFHFGLFKFFFILLLLKKWFNFVMDNRFDFSIWCCWISINFIKISFLKSHSLILIICDPSKS